MRGHDDFLINVGKKSISRFGLLWLMPHHVRSWPTARRAMRNFFYEDSRRCPLSMAHRSHGHRSVKARMEACTLTLVW
jgi:hypothetical protein